MLELQGQKKTYTYHTLTQDIDGGNLYIVKKVDF